MFNSIKKRIKHLGINLTKQIYDMSIERLQNIVKEIRGDVNKQKVSHVHELENSFQMTILPKLIYRFNTTHIETPAALFAEIRRVILKLKETQGTQNSQNNFQRTNLQTHSLISKLSINLQLVWYWHKDRYLDQ